MTTLKFQCPHCRRNILVKSKEMEELRNENAQLRAELEEIRDQIRLLASDLHYYQQGFVASKRRNIFHRPECKWAAYILDSPSLIEFETHQEAVDAGYKPCKTCCA